MISLSGADDCGEEEFRMSEIGEARIPRDQRRVIRLQRVVMVWVLEAFGQVISVVLSREWFLESP